VSHSAVAVLPCLAVVVGTVVMDLTRFKPAARRAVDEKTLRHAEDDGPLGTG
jgi:hypothetical protein